jgi:Zn-finger protein
MKTKYPILKENQNGWTDWVILTKEGYKLACCDCGLVHDMDFKIVDIIKENENGTFETKAHKNKKLEIMFRASRNNRSTGQLRRNKKHVKN